MAAHDDYRQALGRIEGALEGILREQTRIADYTSGISVRVNAVERKQSWIVGWAGGAGALAAAMFSFLFKYFERTS